MGEKEQPQTGGEGGVPYFAASFYLMEVQFFPNKISVKTPCLRNPPHPPALGDMLEQAN